MTTTRPPNDHPPPRGFAALAGRISRWTSRVLLSAVVVAAGVGFARQVLQWWRDDAAASAPPSFPAPGVGDPWATHEVIVGEQPWSIVRQAFEGDAEAAVDALLAACRTAAGETDGGPLPPPGPEERDLLARLAAGEPDAHAPGGVSLYSLPDGFPMVVGTRPGDQGGPAGVGAQPPDRDPRIAAWGIAVPATPTNWSLYTFRPNTTTGDGSAQPAGNRAAADGPAPPLPPGCRRLMEVRAVDGGRSIVFVGPAPPGEWKEFYDGWAVEAGLQRQGGWRPSRGAWYATYRSALPGGGAVVDFHLDQGRGLILVAP